MNFQFRRTAYDTLNTVATAAAYLLRDGDNALKNARAERSDDFDLHEAIRTKAAVVPTSAATVSQFSQTAVSDLASVIGPMSAFSQITSRALGLSRNNNAGISIPHGLAAADTVSFVAQGAPISVKQFSFGSVTIATKKAAAIVALTRELTEHSEAEKIIRQLLIENVGVSVDKLMLDSTDTDGIRPAGLRFGTAALTSAGATKMLEDLTTLAAAVAPKASSMDDIVFVASVDLAVKIALALPLLKIPVIGTAGFSAGTIAAMVPSALAVEAAPEINFSVSDSTALHMEDTSPLPISTVATPNTVAAPVRSLWQTDAKAVRLIFEVDWKWRVPGAVAWMTTVGW
jgi:hypothetical protein